MNEREINMLYFYEIKRNRMDVMSEGVLILWNIIDKLRREVKVQA